MNKKSQAAIAAIVFMAVIILLIVLILKPVSYQHGTSKDIVQGYDKGIIWYHVYLLNDHHTAYCFDDEKFIPLLEQSQKNNEKIIITYEKYVIRGCLCSSSDNYENVIITNVELEKQ